MPDTPPNDLQAVVVAGQDPSVPQVYFNGFVTATALGDGLLILQRAGKPVATLYASYPVLKTLAVKLSSFVSELEAAVGPISTLEQLEAGLTKKSTNVQ